MAQRAGDFLTIPLCWDCHQGPRGVHGDKGLMRQFKKTELEMLNETVGALVCGMRSEGASRDRSEPEDDGGEMVLPGASQSTVAFAAEVALVNAERDTVKFRLHPEDDNIFVADKPGTRYGLAASRLDEAEHPVVKRTKLQQDGYRALRMAASMDAVSSAGALPRSEAFAQFASQMGFDDPAQYIRSYCNIASRAQLSTSRSAAGLYAYMLERFRRWIA